MRTADLERIISENDPKHAATIEERLRAELTRDSDAVLRALRLAQQWQPRRLMDAIRPLLEHSAKPVRSAAARTLASCGDAATEHAAELLVHKKAYVRLAAAELLAGIGSEKALAALEARLDEESNDDVRDQMLQGLEAAWTRQGRRITKAEIQLRMKRAGGKLDAPVAGWLKEDALPALKWADGDRLSQREVRYLLYRQSRSKEIRPDPEAAAVCRLINRAGSGAFAAAVLHAFLHSRQEAADRWVLTVAAMLGDDAIVPTIVSQIRTWVENQRGKLAEYAVEALALLGTDAALLAVDSMSIRYRTKMKNVGRAANEAFVLAAKRQGLTPDELGDRVVTWLCFRPNEACVIGGGQSRFEVRIGPDSKLRFIDLQKNKPVKSLPKSVDDAVKKEMKEVAANLREVAKAQALRLQNLLVRQRRWPAARWRELFLLHPVLLPFAVRIVWGAYDANGKLTGLFRALEDRTLTTEAEDAYELPEGVHVGMVHPLELDPAVRSAWIAHLADYEIEPPFPQMERDVVLLPDSDRKRRSVSEFAGRTLNGMTFKGRAERLGWNRGSVIDAGCISSYQKGFPSAGVDAMILVDDMFMGMDMYATVTLGPGYFVHSGSVTFGSYVYDEPKGEKARRVLSFSEVPPIVFSEVMGDLKRIAGGQAAEE